MLNLELISTNNQPTYDLQEIKDLVRNGSFSASKRVTHFLLNHGFRINETITGVIENMSIDNFYKCDELEKLPGVRADIYRNVAFDGEEWYVKFYKEENGVTVTFWSCKTEGYAF